MDYLKVISKVNPIMIRTFFEASVFRRIRMSHRESM